MLKFNENLKAFFAIGFLVALIDADGAVDFSQNRIVLKPVDHEYVRSVNEAFFVTCEGEEDDHLTWTRPDGRDVDVKGRVHVERADNQLRLIFDSITKEDDGSWSCRLEGHEGKEKSFVMNVYEPIKFEAVDSILTVREGDNAVIRCEVTGQPAPKIHWAFDGERMLEKFKDNPEHYKKLEDGLFIHKSTRSDSGEYTCKAVQSSSLIMDAKEQTVRLVVQYKPIIIRHYDHRYGFINGVVNLTCEADAEPKASFFWYRKGKRITKNVHDDENFSSLKVYIGSNASFGDYKCKAKNDLGEEEKTTELVEGTKPDSPKTFFIRGLSSDTFDIDVGAKVDPTKRHRMEVNGYQFQMIPIDVFREQRSWNKSMVKDFAVADGATYLLSPLSENTTYMVRVASRNAAGLSEFTEAMQFTTLSKQPNISSPSSHLHISVVFVAEVLVVCSILKRQFVKV